MFVKNGWRLVDATGKDMSLGDKVTTFRGEIGYLEGGAPPHKPSSTGRVVIRSDESALRGEFYPSVIGTAWVREP